MKAKLAVLCVVVLAFSCGQSASESSLADHPLVGGSAADMAAFDSEQRVNFEAAIKSCMKVQGFDYVPQDPRWYIATSVRSAPAYVPPPNSSGYGLAKANLEPTASITLAIGFTR